MTDRERCEVCAGSGWAEGEPSPTPQGPSYPLVFCTACDGTGWVEVDETPAEEEDLFR